MSEICGCVELALFRLRSGVSEAEFLKRAGDAGLALAEYPGFQSRELRRVHDSDEWADVIRWETRAHAEAAAEKILLDDRAAPFMGCLAPESIVMRHLL